MTSTPHPANRRIQHEKGLLLDELSDRLESLRLLRTKDPEAAAALLESFGTQGKVEEQMVEELSTVNPIAYPDRFEEAHRRGMRALEVYDRNGPRTPSAISGVPKPLRVPATYLVQVMVRMIVRDHQKSLATSIRQLYAMREASAAPASPEHRMLARARRQVDSIRADLNKNSLPLPAIASAGALFSGVLSVLQKGLTDELGRLILLGVFAVLGLMAFWCVLRAAAVARRRTRIGLDAQMKALWEVMGDAGSLSEDESNTFAQAAIGVLIAVWVVVPILVWLAINHFQR